MTEDYESNEAECWNCGGTGETEHDCFDDTCCCLNPEPEMCEVCGGDGWIKVGEA